MRGLEDKKTRVVMVDFAAMIAAVGKKQRSVMNTKTKTTTRRCR